MKISSLPISVQFSLDTPDTSQTDPDTSLNTKESTGFFRAGCSVLNISALGAD